MPTDLPPRRSDTLGRRALRVYLRIVWPVAAVISVAAFVAFVVIVALGKSAPVAFLMMSVILGVIAWYARRYVQRDDT